MDSPTTRHLRIAVLVKQIPATDSLQLGRNGRLVRAGLALDINSDADAPIFAEADLGIDTPQRPTDCLGNACEPHDHGKVVPEAKRA